MRWTHISWKLYGPWVGGAYLAWLLGSAVSQAGGTGVPGNSSPPPNFSCPRSASRYPTGSCCIAHEILVSSSQVVFLNLTVFPPCLLFLVSGSFPFFLVSKRGRFCLCRSCRLSTLTEKKKMSKQMIFPKENILPYFCDQGWTYFLVSEAWLLIWAKCMAMLSTDLTVSV